MIRVAVRYNPDTRAIIAVAIGCGSLPSFTGTPYQLEILDLDDWVERFGPDMDDVLEQLKSACQVRADLEGIELL